MIFITDADITDDVLVVDQSDIDAANAYVGSVQAKFAIADEDIADPLPYNIRRLAIVYACYTAALDAVGTDATETMGENRQRIDIYEQKAQSVLRRTDRAVRIYYSSRLYRDCRRRLP